MMNISTWSAAMLMTGGAALLAASSQPAAAATLCVNPGGKGGCFTMIGAAVGAANGGDVIQVAQGKYTEGDIVIAKPLSLIGANSANTIINAIKKGNGIYVDGLDHPGLGGVVVTGFTIQNANFEGILVTNASSVTISDNRVVSNNLALDLSLPAPNQCPGLPSFETNEGMDCGEGIHLLGADHSIVANNTIENNSGGVLLSDDTGLTNDNVIEGNVVRNNAFDCGITLASHAPAAITGAAAPFGVVRNTISGNESSHNGLGLAGAGAGVGLFAPGPGNRTSANVVIGNRLTDNGLPGVAIHNHAPVPTIDLSDNVIVGNYIAGNGQDDDVPTTVPTGISLLGVKSPVSGLIITLNDFARESIDIAINNAGGTVDVHLNNLKGGGTGIDNSGAGAVNATENWWGCAKGPGAPGCTSVEGAGVTFIPFLTKPAGTPSPQ